MTWEIVVGIITLVGFVVSIATLASKLSRTLASLEAALKTLCDTLEELKKNNKESHKDIYHKLDDHECKIIRIMGKLGME